MGSLWLLYTFYSGSYWRSREMILVKDAGELAATEIILGLIIFVSHHSGKSRKH